MEIWDLHCHLATASGSSPEQRLADLLRYADRMGIARLCVYMGMQFVHDPSPKEFRRQNDEVLEALKAWSHRAFGFVYVNPKHLKESLDEINRCIADGPMIGVKLWVARRATAPEVDAIVERATELKAVVFQHTWMKVAGNLPGESTPMDLAALAARHPDAKLFAGTPAAIGSRASVRSVLRRMCGPTWLAATRWRGSPNWRCGNLALNACCMAATPAAEVLQRSCRRCTAPIFQTRPGD